MKCNVQSCFFSHLSKIKNVSKTDFWVKLYFQLTFVLKISPLSLKWRIFSRTGKIGSGKNTKYIFFSYWAWGHVLSLKPIWQLKQEAVKYNNLNFCPLCFKGWPWQCTAVATKRICWNSLTTNSSTLYVKGAFNNYVDQILPNFDRLPTLGGQLLFI